MWLPVVSDSSVLGSAPRAEAHIEALIDILPAAATGEILFAWVRDTPGPLSPGQGVFAFREDAAPADRLAALVRTPDGALVLEIYAANVVAGQTEGWLEENWGIRNHGLCLTSMERMEVAIAAAFLHWCVQRGMVEEAKAIIRLIGRVIFRAAVRRITDKLLRERSKSHNRRDRISSPEPGPITAAEVSATDMDALLRQLLGLDTTEGDNRHCS